MKQLTIQEANTLAVDILRRYAFAESHIEAMVATMMAGQLDDCYAHGLYRLLGCIKTVKAGKAIIDAMPEVIDQAFAIVKVDAKGGFSPLAFNKGLPILLAKAQQSGIAALAINKCVHFSALWVELEQIVAEGLVALACNPSHAWVTPFGGAKPLLGTNPIAFGFPRQGKDPYIFDFATSEIARGEIELYRLENKPIPAGWGVDANGNITTDAAQVLDEGAMLAFGGYKGAALSTMIELIAGPLIGDLTSNESLAFDAATHSLPYHGELIIALDPKKFLSDKVDYYLAHAEQFFNDIQQTGARLPSARRYKAREKNLKNNSISLSKKLYADLQQLLIDPTAGH